MTFSEKIGLSFRSFGTAHKFILKNNLWHFVYIPGIINVFIFYFSFNWFIGEVAGFISGIFEFECGDGFWGLLCGLLQVLSWFLEILVRWILYVTFIGIYLYIYKNLILLIYSPVLAYLIELVEKKHKGIDTPFNMEQFLKDTVRGIILALRGLFVEGVVMLALFIMAFVPIINFLQPVLMWLVSAYFLGVSMIDYSLERNGLNVKESINYSKKHKSLATGIGSVFQLVFIIPFVGWMIAPTYSAVAAYFAVDELNKIEN